MEEARQMAGFSADPGSMLLCGLLDYLELLDHIVVCPGGSTPCAHAVTFSLIGADDTDTREQEPAQTLGGSGIRNSVKFVFPLA